MNIEKLYALFLETQRGMNKLQAIPFCKDLTKYLSENRKYTTLTDKTFVVENMKRLKKNLSQFPFSYF